MWIENSAGTFIRTLFVSNRSSTRPSELPNWYAKSNGVTNGTTGASKNPGSYTSNWIPCYNSVGSLVASGTYRYRIETSQQGGVIGATYLGTIILGSSSNSTNGTTGNFITSFSATYAP